MNYRVDDDVATETETVPDMEANGASLPTPEEMRATITPSRGSSSWKKRLLYYGVPAILLIVLIIGVSVGVSNKKNSGGEERRASFVDVFEFMVENEVSDRSTFDNSQSPQSKAARWMAEEDPLNLGVPSSDVEDNEGYKFMQRYVLAVCYFANGGDNWISPFQFLTGAPTCGWSGILGILSNGSPYYFGSLCDSSTGVIDRLYLRLNRLTGAIPEEVGALTTLRVADFDRNNLGGFLPSSICQLTNLEIIRFSGNSIAGTIPDCIGDLEQLTVFDASDNMLEESIPSSFGLLTNLVGLYIDDNFLSGDVEVLFRDMDFLMYFYGEGNFLFGSINGDFLQNNNVLRFLDLSDNDIDGQITDDIWNWENLTLVDLHANRLDGPIPTPEEEHANMRLFSAQQNSLSGEIPGELNLLTALFHLDLSDNDFSGTMPTEFGEMDSLIRLYLSRIEFDSGPIPSEYSSLSGLRELSIKESFRTGGIPTFLGSFENLTLLDLDGNGLEAEIPSELGDLTSLEFLLLNNNPLLNGTLPASFSKLENLRAFIVDQTAVTGNINFMCSVSTFGNPSGEEVFIANCDEGSSIECRCCTECCSDDEVDCHDNDLVSSLKPSWENGFGRTSFTFGNDTVFDD